MLTSPEVFLPNQRGAQFDCVLLSHLSAMKDWPQLTKNTDPDTALLVFHSFNSHTSLTRDCCRQFRCASSGSESKVRITVPPFNKSDGTGNSLNSPMPLPYWDDVSSWPLQRKRASP